jgi:hypothetical protein
VALFNKAGSRITWVSATSSSAFVDAPDVYYTPSYAADGIVDGSAWLYGGRWFYNNAFFSHWLDKNPSITVSYPCSEELGRVDVYGHRNELGR